MLVLFRFCAVVARQKCAFAGISGRFIVTKSACETKIQLDWERDEVDFSMTICSSFVRCIRRTEAVRYVGKDNCGRFKVSEPEVG
jgi:hypothetical protein